MQPGNNTRPRLIDAARAEDTAAVAFRSAEALFRYLSRLDELQGADLSREALADRAAEAESHMRILLGAGLDALNELNDLGLFNAPPTDEEIRYFNETSFGEAVGRAVGVLRGRLPAQRWDWIDDARRLVGNVEMRLERDKEGLRATIKSNRRARTVRLDPAAPATRVSTREFFSDGPDRVFTPSSALLKPREGEGEGEPVSGYDALVGGMAFAREWVYRHARYAAEVGPPARTGGGPALVVIAVVLIVAAVVSSVIALVLTIICAAGEDDACRPAAYFGAAASILGYGAEKADDKAKQLQYGTNNQ